MKRKRLRPMTAKYRILMGSGGALIELLSSNKKKRVGLVNLNGVYTVDNARRLAREMYPDAKDVTP